MDTHARQLASQPASPPGRPSARAPRVPRVCEVLSQRRQHQLRNQPHVGVGAGVGAAQHAPLPRRLALQQRPPGGKGGRGQARLLQRRPAVQLLRQAGQGLRGGVG